MFPFYVLIFFKKGDTIQRGTLLKGGHYLRKYGNFKGKKMLIKKMPSKLGWAVFSTANQSQNQDKYQILFHQNGSPCDLYIMTLATGSD